MTATFWQFILRICLKKTPQTIQTIHRLSIKILWGQRLGGKPIVWSVSGFLIYLIPITSVARDCANKEYLHKIKPAHLGVLDRKVYKCILVFPGNSEWDWVNISFTFLGTIWTINSTEIMMCIAEVSLTWMYINWIFQVYWDNHKSRETGSWIWTEDQHNAWALLMYHFRPILGHK